MKRITLIMAVVILASTFFSPKVLAWSDKAAPSVTSEAAIMIDADTGSILFVKKANESMYPASLTKIATAIYAIETGNLSDMVTISKRARNIEGTRVYLVEGEQITLKNLIQGLLINSGNDAGVAIAEHLSGNVEKFSSDINSYLQNVIGVKNTNFTNPHGLFDPNHVSTAEDLARITQYAIKNEVFQEIFGKTKLDWDGETWDTTVYTHHKLMREMPYKGVTGGKTGYVDQSGFTLATTAKRNELELIVITLDSNMQSEAYTDTKTLLDYGFEYYRHSTVPKGEIFTIYNEKYKTPKALTYTHLSREGVHKEIDAQGVLKIINQNGTVINSFQLKSIKKQRNENELYTGVSNKNSNHTLVSSGSFIVISILTLCLVCVYYRKHKNTT